MPLNDKITIYYRDPSDMSVTVTGQCIANAQQGEFYLKFSSSQFSTGELDEDKKIDQLSFASIENFQFT